MFNRNKNKILKHLAIEYDPLGPQLLKANKHSFKDLEHIEILYPPKDDDLDFLATHLIQFFNKLLEARKVKNFEFHHKQGDIGGIIPIKKMLRLEQLVVVEWHMTSLNRLQKCHAFKFFDLSPNLIELRFNAGEGCYFFKPKHIQDVGTLILNNMVPQDFILLFLNERRRKIEIFNTDVTLPNACIAKVVRTAIFRSAYPLLKTLFEDFLDEHETKFLQDCVNDIRYLKRRRNR